MNYENEIKKIKESIIKLYDVVDALTYETNLIQSNKPFKVGDRVQFKTWEEMENEFGLDIDFDIQTYCDFRKGMKHLCGTYATIKQINGEGVELCDFTANGDTLWCYSLDMLKHAENEPKWVFTEEEKMVLMNINSKYKYIARDCNNKLYIYEYKPEKFEICWSISDFRFKLLGNLFGDMFKCIKWTDEEPCEFRKYI